MSDDEESKRAYSALLSLLGDKARKKRKTPKASPKPKKKVPDESDDKPEHHDSDAIEGAGDDIQDGSEEELTESEEDVEIEVDEDVEDVKDPFEWHFSAADLDDLEESDITGKESLKVDAGMLGSRSQFFSAKIEPSKSEKLTVIKPLAPAISKPDSLRLKYRLEAPFKRTNPQLSELQKAFAGPLFNYQDIFFLERTWENYEELQNIVSLHVLNHVFKTRDRVIKNNYKISQAQQANEELEVKDQGFVRPKALILLPTRQSAVRFLKSIIDISGLNQVENKKRFSEQFQSETDPVDGKPEDFQKMFEGNTNDLFCLGVKFTRQAVKLYTSFYSSDLIIASPLGLRMIIGDEGSKKRDYDFLSSIEVVVADQVEAAYMQSWENIKHIFKHMNLMPKEAHGCDFSRVRSWYLDGKAKYLRQTILMSEYSTPEMYHLQTNLCHNLGGQIRCRGPFKGSMSTVGLKLRQVYTRISASSPAQDHDDRFAHFTTATLPSILRGSSHDGTLIFFPSYFDFVRVRNFMEKGDHSYVTLSEYSKKSQVSRGRSYFQDGRAKIMLYTQRLHFYRRLNIKGVKQVIFYGLPDNPSFYQEIVRFLGRTCIEQGIDPDMLKVMVLFSKWDSLKLERIVGTNRVGPLVQGVNTSHQFY